MRCKTANSIPDVTSRKLLFLLVMLLMQSLPGVFPVFTTVLATPYVPLDGKTVLQTLPEKLTIPLTKSNELNTRSVFNPYSEQQWQNEQQAMIMSYFKKARLSGDSRYISYAKNQLEKWSEIMPDSEKKRLLNALILQYEHHFNEAISELNRLLSDYPRNVQAWSLLANLQLLTGKYPEAESSCNMLAKTSSLVDVIICKSNVLSRTGSLQSAYRMMTSLLPIINSMPVKQKIWVYTSIAEMQMQLGDDEKFEIIILNAIKLAKQNDIYSGYALRLYVDYLEHNDRLDDAYKAAIGLKQDTALQIRAATLAKHLGDMESSKKITSVLTQKFAIEEQRGDSRHLREQALFLLLLTTNTFDAFKLARQNWMQQKEAEDARILLKAAVLLGDESHIQEVLTSIAKIGLVDQRLDIVRLRSSIL